MTSEPDRHDAIIALHAKQARRARWTRIGGTILALVFAIRLGVYLLTPASAQDCDASAVTSALTELVDEASTKGGSTAKVTTINGVKTVVDDSKLRRCTSHVVMSDKSEGTLTYHVDPKQVMVDSLK